MSTNSQVVTSLYLWSDGHSSVYGPGESAEVSAPGWLFNSEDTDPDTHRELLANFKDKIIEAFALIWGEKDSCRIRLRAGGAERLRRGGLVHAQCHLRDCRYSGLHAGAGAFPGGNEQPSPLSCSTPALNFFPAHARKSQGLVNRPASSRQVRAPTIAGACDDSCTGQSRVCGPAGG